MSLSVILELIKGLDPLTAVLLVVVVIIALSQGWIVVKGINIGKKKKKESNDCVRGKAGSCSLIEQQMQKAEEHIQEVRTKALNIYLTKRKEILGTKRGLYKDRDYHHYSAILFQAEEKVKDDIRNFFHKNHLAEMSDIEFESHARERANLLVGRMSEYLDQFYYADSEPDTVALYDLNHEKLLPDVLMGITASFRNARRLAIEFQEDKLCVGSNNA